MSLPSDPAELDSAISHKAATLASAAGVDLDTSQSCVPKLQGADVEALMLVAAGTAEVVHGIGSEAPGQRKRCEAGTWIGADTLLRDGHASEVHEVGPGTPVVSFLLFPSR